MSSPDYSIVIPAYNEEEYLPHTLKLVKAAMNDQSLAGEIIVADNNSTDRTADIAREYGATVAFEPQNQISRARNAGARASRGKYLVFLDADTELTGELLTLALDNLETGVCVGGGVRVDTDTPAGTIARKGLEFWNWIAPKLHMAAGCFLYSRRDAFDGVGGFSERVYAGEDAWFARSIRKWGKKQGLDFRIITEPGIRTSLRKLDWYSWKQIALYSMLIFFPFAIFSKRLCAFWYNKPDPETGKTKTW